MAQTYILLEVRACGQLEVPCAHINRFCLFELLKNIALVLGTPQLVPRK